MKRTMFVVLVSAAALVGTLPAGAWDLRCAWTTACKGEVCRPAGGGENWVAILRADSGEPVLSADGEQVPMRLTRAGPVLQFEGTNAMGMRESLAVNRKGGAFTWLRQPPERDRKPLTYRGRCEVTD